MTTRRSTIAEFTLVAAGLLTLASVADAQRGRRNMGFEQMLGNSGDYYVPPDFAGIHPYDGRFTFARIKYRGYDRMAQEGPGWSHDYPRAESHLTRILREIT